MGMAVYGSHANMDAVYGSYTNMGAVLYCCWALKVIRTLLSKLLDFDVTHPHPSLTGLGLGDRLLAVYVTHPHPTLLGEMQGDRLFVLMYVTHASPGLCHMSPRSSGLACMQRLCDMLSSLFVVHVLVLCSCVGWLQAAAAL